MKGQADTTERVAKIISEFAEGLGFLTVHQFFAFDAVCLDDGSEWVVSTGPLRYTLKKASEDAKEAPGRMAVTYVVRYIDQDDPEDMKAYAKHKRAELEEINAGGKG